MSAVRHAITSTSPGRASATTEVARRGPGGHQRRRQVTVRARPNSNLDGPRPVQPAEASREVKAVESVTHYGRVERVQLLHQWVHDWVTSAVSGEVER